MAPASHRSLATQSGLFQSVELAVPLDYLIVIDGMFFRDLILLP
jgi:hypothetical protein